MYIYMQSWKQCALPVIPTMALWQLMHLGTWCTVNFLSIYIFPDSEKIKIKLFEIFKSNGLSITVECNLIATDFLDVTFYLKFATCYPHRKPNNELLYINKHSNHPPSTINQIPLMISNRVSENSSEENHFD